MFNKKIKTCLLISLCCVNFLFASEKISIPLPAESLSVENSGLKQPIDAYQDGVGIYTMEALGANKVDNSEMNALVFKYGEAAKELNISVKEYVQTNGTNSEKELASTVGKFEPMVPGNGTLCNDNNAQTINDRYQNGICIGDIKKVNVAYFILKNAYWPATYKMFGLSFSINNIPIEKNQTDFLSKGVTDDSIFNSTTFAFYENKVTGELSTMNSKPVKITFKTPIEIDSYSDIVVDYVGGAFWYLNQRIDTFTLEFYTDTNELISSKVYSGLSNGIKYNNTGIYYCKTLTVSCLNLVPQLNPNYNLQLNK